MQSKNKISLFPEYTRYEDYINTKRYYRNQCGPEIFPIQNNENRITNKSKNQRANCITARYYKDGKENLIQVGVINKGAQGQRVYDPDGIACSLTGCSGGHGGNTGLYQITTTQPRCGNPKRGGTGRLSSTFYSFTVDSNPHIVNDIRRLTPTECEKLQGFQVGWTEGISDSQRYKCLGNAVTVPIVKLVAEKLKNAIRKEEKG